MNPNIKISIITISFNAEEHIERTIKSVIAQGYDNLEYIIIDGGSSDGTIDIIKKYAQFIHYWVSEKDNGISDAFNKGIKAASGELVGLLNADDYYLNNTLKIISDNHNGSDIIYGNMRTIVNGENKGDFQADHNFLEDDMTICHPSTFIRKDAYLKWGLYSQDYSLAMDYELLLRHLTSGARFQKIDHTLTAMQMEGVSNMQWKSAFKEVIRAQDLHLGLSKSRTIKNKLKLSKKTIAQSLSNSPLSFIVLAYKRRFSKIKKK